MSWGGDVDQGISLSKSSLGSYQPAAMSIKFIRRLKAKLQKLLITSIDRHVTANCIGKYSFNLTSRLKDGIAGPAVHLPSLCDCTKISV